MVERRIENSEVESSKLSVPTQTMKRLCVSLLCGDVFTFYFLILRKIKKGFY